MIGPFAASVVEPLRVGDLVDEAALVEHVQEIGLEGGHVWLSGERRGGIGRMARWSRGV